MNRILLTFPVTLLSLISLAQTDTTRKTFRKEVERLSWEREVENAVLTKRLEDYYYSLSTESDTSSRRDWAKTALLMDMRKYLNFTALYDEKLMRGKKVERAALLDSVFKAQGIRLPTWYDQIMLNRVEELNRLYDLTRKPKKQ